MILKTSSLLYLFDFDGTIAGSDTWYGYLKNCKLSFQHLHFNPDPLDIRWCILTSRPRIDNLLLKILCKYHKLNPQQIIMGPSLTWKFKEFEQEVKYKEQIIKSILDGTFKINYTSRKITKLCYIDNNIPMIKMLNTNRGDYHYIAISVADFMSKDYIQLL